MPGASKIMGQSAMLIDDACGRLHSIVGGLPAFPFPALADRLPRNGLYVLYEKDECGHGGRRIVRIGSHTGSGNLPKRLAEHTTANKDRSIFRKNLGRALLNRSGDPFLEQWNWDLTTKANRERYEPLLDKVRQRSVENEVTAYVMDSFAFSVLPVDDRATRLGLERAMIATVAQCRHCRASVGWLGNSSPVESIRTSGLWLKQHLVGPMLTDHQLQWLSQGIQ